MIKRINKIKTLFNDYGINGYIIPKNDKYFSEYSFPNRLRTISNFSGSAGFAIILKNENLLFVDGRYTLQSKIESGNNFKIFQIPKVFPFNLFYDNKLKIGYDPNLFTSSVLNLYFRKQCQLVPINYNLIDKIHFEAGKNKEKNFFCLNEKVTGESVNSKIKKILKILKHKKIDNIFISSPENVAWLLNIRGFDNPNSPIPNCRLILCKDKKIYFFSSNKKIKKIKKKLNFNKIKFYHEKSFYEVLSKLKGKFFSIDYKSCSIYFENLIKSKFQIKNFDDPCYSLKSIKNKIEIKNMMKTHVEDGVALTKFLYYLKNKKNKNLDELGAEKKLEKLRKNNKNYLYPSFNTIAGTGPNGAIIHYRATNKTNRKINVKDIFLCDSGGQYKYGTTDVTRTVCFTKPSKKIKNIFTRVLKGHIAVATTNIKKLKNGNNIDKKARLWLNKINLNYEHGTGHGVGFFLNVHEGPQSISKNNFIKLKEGMILSNEPGYYEEKKFGIRIENLIYIKKVKKELFFENLTLAPIDKDLIDFNLLNKREKQYLSNYHSKIYNKLSDYLNYSEKKWLRELF